MISYQSSVFVTRVFVVYSLVIYTYYLQPALHVKINSSTRYKKKIPLFYLIFLVKYFFFIFFYLFCLFFHNHTSLQHNRGITNDDENVTDSNR